MTGELLFISDLHLSADRPLISRHLFDFLRGPAAEAEALYILGDLFDSWIGDDAIDAFSAEVIAALARLSGSGVGLYIQHGNRDFLLGEAFCEQTGAVLIGEQTCLQLGEQRVLLMHGDLLCSDDLDYQQARQMLRDLGFIADFLSKPLAQRRLLAEEYRRRSGEAISRKPAAIMDANPHSVSAYLAQHQAQLLIHGHTHRPGRQPQRLVLGAWEEDGACCLRWKDGQFELFDYPANGQQITRQTQ
ncbi:MAG: UDP-2,3-diacylglucosamine diphosphatase [Gammaproteobacteria bacterium]|nr:UDP-2,3-diacylglucosamine diphosphatase [Gammaproteobacteria bacterium]